MAESGYASINDSLLNAVHEETRNVVCGENKRADTKSTAFFSAFFSSHFRLLCRICLRDNCIKERKWLWPFLLLLSAVIYEVSAVFIMYTISSFYESVTSLDFHLFLKSLLYSILIITVTSTALSARTYLMNRVALNWRKSLVLFFHERLNKKENCKIMYSRIRSKYTILDVIDGQNNTHKRIDTLDQRISEDVDELTQNWTSLVNQVIELPYIIIFYTAYLWQLCGFLAPVICYAYFFVANSLTLLSGRGISSVVYNQERLEGTFRYQQVTTWQNIEAICLLLGLEFELRKSVSIFETLIDNKSLMIWKQMYMSLVTNWFTYFGSIVNYGAVGASIFLFGNITEDDEGSLAAQLSKGSYSCLYLISAFSTVFATLNTYVVAKGLLVRVGELFQLLDNNETIDDISSYNSSRFHSPSSDNNLDQSKESELLLRVSNFDVCTLEDTVLIKSLSLDVYEGMKVLVSGPSGCGKSTFMKLLAGILDYESAPFDHLSSIQFYCNRNDVMFCPQRAYCFSGTLTDNITYQGSNSPFQLQPSLATYKKISACLKASGLVKLSLYYDAFNEFSIDDIERDWACLLSYGEQQMLSIARVLYCGPKFVFLDEATSNVDEEMERLIYRHLSATCTTIVTFGHRSSLLAYHTHSLKIMQNNVSAIVEL